MNIRDRMATLFTANWLQVKQAAADGLPGRVADVALPVVQAALADAFREGYRQGAQDEADPSDDDNPYRAVQP